MVMSNTAYKSPPSSRANSASWSTNSPREVLINVAPGRIRSIRPASMRFFALGGEAPAAVPAAVVIDDDGARVRGHVTLSTGQQLDVLFAF